MEPKTKLQKKIVELSGKLRPITEMQKKWAFDKCLSSYAVRLKKTLYCLECGHSWKDKSVLVTSIVGCTCPCCGKELKLNNNYRRLIIECEYFSIIEIMEGMQVVRMFFVKKTGKKRQKAIYAIDEVMQHWVNENGKVTTIAKQVRGLTQCYDSWICDSFLEIRTESYNAKLRAELAPYKVYPKMKILPVIRRNGFKGFFYSFAPHLLFSFILNDQFAETLLKTGQIDLLNYHYNNPSTVVKMWKSIKICIRKDYKIKDASDWLDYLRLLNHFGKDLHIPKYICPEDFKPAHDRIVRKKREQDRKLRLNEMRDTIEVEQKDYDKQKGKFFNIQFGDEEILIKPIKTVEEFMIEGDILDHCVFTNEYYKKVNSLILSARINNKPIETIEVLLSDSTIVQSRGIRNQPTKYHNRIINLVESNIGKHINLIS